MCKEASKQTLDRRILRAGTAPPPVLKFLDPRLIPADLQIPHMAFYFLFILIIIQTSRLALIGAQKRSVARMLLITSLMT